MRQPQRWKCACAGSIRLTGQPNEGPGADRGAVFQKDTLLPWATVIDDVALSLTFAGRSKGDRDEKAEELLHLEGLSDFAKSYAHEARHLHRVDGKKFGTHEIGLFQRFILCGRPALSPVGDAH